MSLVPLAPFLDLLGMTGQIARYASLGAGEDQSFSGILGRRSDGFHEIETFIAPISLFDEIKIAQRSGKQRSRFSCDDPSVPQGEDNLVVRATNCSSRKRGHQRCSIELKKRIPHGAGLGGGSSDAASTLLALNKLFETNLPREAMAKMAETIGSDVPFFIFQSAAVCKGRGEIVTRPDQANNYRCCSQA